MNHHLRGRDGHDECIACGQTFEDATRTLAEIAPCQISGTEPHVWTTVPSGAEYAYCLTAITGRTSSEAIPADCIQA